MSSEKTPLYQEALIEVKTLKELAKKEAEKTLLEKLSPLIDQVISREISGTSVLLEQDEDPAAMGAAPGQDPMATPPVPAPVVAPDMSAQPQMPATAPLDTAAVPPVDPTQPVGELPASEETVPAETAPIASNSSLAIPVPGPDGKITVDIEALFNATPAGSEPNFAGASVTPASTGTELPAMGGEEEPMPEMPVEEPAATEAPAPTPGAETPAPEEAPQAEQPAQLTEAFKQSLKMLDQQIKKQAVGKNSISADKADLLKNQVFSLYETAQHLKNVDGISKSDIAYGEVRMELMFAKLKESAKQDNSYKRQLTIKEDSKMAKKEFRTLKEFAASLFAEEVEAKGASGFEEDGVPGVRNTTTANVNVKVQKVEDPGREESLRLGADLSENFGAGEDVLAEEDGEMDAELMEMLSSLEDEDSASAEQHGEEDGASKLGMTKESAVKRMKQLQEEQKRIAIALKECEMAVVEDHDEDHKEESEEESDESSDSDTVSVDELKSMSLEDLMKLVSGEAEADSDDEEIELVDDEDEQDEEEEKSDSRLSVVSESRVSKENKDLRKQLAETQLLTARSLFVSKLFAEHNLSVGTKQKIVEYIDSARNLEEAKTNYARVKKMLEESTKPTRKFGSSSRAGASAAPVLKESASSPYNLEMNPNRWMQLAGITKKSV